MTNSYYFADISSDFQFGKHYGTPLAIIIKQNPSYIYWCINNIPSFTISPKALEQIRMLFPQFIITSDFSNHIGYILEEHGDDYDDYDDTSWQPYEEEDTYERYNGSYAQDEMGYSDDDIDTIFDGDPLAYWNID